MKKLKIEKLKSIKLDNDYQRITATQHVMNAVY
jgi:hypothetical protein